MNLQIPETGWVDIPGYEGYYQAHASCMFRSMDRIVKCNSGTVKLAGRILTQSTTQEGYLKVGLSKNNKVKNFKVHLLLAKIFKPNPNPGKYRLVRHLNDVKTDNRLDNLEWGTDAHNVADCIRNGTHRVPRGKSHHWYGRRVAPPNKGLKGKDALNAKILLDTQTGIYYHGTNEAANAFGMNPNTLRSKMSGFIKNNTSLIYV